MCGRLIVLFLTISNSTLHAGEEATAAFKALRRAGLTKNPEKRAQAQLTRSIGQENLEKIGIIAPFLNGGISYRGEEYQFEYSPKGNKINLRYRLDF